MISSECPPPCLHPTHIISASQIRQLAGIRQRNTLIRWRRDRDFPAPIRTVPGPGGQVELWDIREVRAWLQRRR